MVEGFLGFLVLCIDVYAVVHVLSSNEPVLKRTVWIIAIVVLPVAGFIAWILFGPRDPRET